MATSRMAPQLHPVLHSRLEEARARTDVLFECLPPNSFYERPIAERHRLIFYLGHLEAFDWNLFAPALGLGLRDAEFDKLFAFGIDPVGDGLPTDRPEDWPNIARVEKYNRQVREALDEALSAAEGLRSAAPEIADGTLLHVAIEHRLMHAETLAYLLHNLAVERKIPQGEMVADPRPAPAQRQVAIPAGLATLGQSRNLPHAFGWDNEFDVQQFHVPSFLVDAFPVTNDEFLKFVRAGGYHDAALWKPEDWEWRVRERLEHPHFWALRSSSPATDPDAQWDYRAMFGRIPLPMSWPVYVSHAEASAFARWSGKKLPSEAQWHRAAYARRTESSVRIPGATHRPRDRTAISIMSGGTRRRWTRIRRAPARSGFSICWATDGSGPRH